MSTREEPPASTTATRAAQRWLGAQLRELDRAAAAVLARASRGHIHDLRVAAYRLEVALELFGARGDIGRELHALRSALGACRDRQNRLAWLSIEGDAAARAAKQLARAEQAPLHEALRAQHAQVIHWKEREASWRSLLLALEVPGRFGGHRLRARFRALARAVERDAASLHERPTMRRAHRMRRDLKRLRYAAELLEPAFPERLAPLVPALAELQRKLGALHDAALRVAWLREARDGSEELRALLTLAKQEKKKRARKLPSLLRRWKKLPLSLR